MGGPNSISEVPIFLKNMFTDPCILSIKSNFIRQMVANLIVNKRLKKSQAIYEKIGGGSPITGITFDLTKKLSKCREDVFFTYAMRYVPPFATSVLEEIKSMGIEEILLFSMYPQYSFTTSLSSFQDILDSLKKIDFKPEVRVVDRYFNNPLYIESIANSIESNLNGKNPKDFVLILSAHSIPQSVINKGDPYEKECNASRDLIIKELHRRNIYSKDCILSYQSKLGPVKWLSPFTEGVIKDNAKSNIIVYPLSFTIDNSETDYELSMQYKEIARDLGIKEYLVCKCLNDSDDFVNLIIRLCKIMH